MFFNCTHNRLFPKGEVPQSQNPHRGLQIVWVLSLLCIIVQFFWCPPPAQGTMPLYVLWMVGCKWGVFQNGLFFEYGHVWRNICRKAVSNNSKIYIWENRARSSSSTFAYSIFRRCLMIVLLFYFWPSHPNLFKVSSISVRAPPKICFPRLWGPTVALVSCARRALVEMWIVWTMMDKCRVKKRKAYVKHHLLFLSL